MLISTARKAIYEPTLRSQLREVFNNLRYCPVTTTAPTFRSITSHRSNSSQAQQVQAEDHDAGQADSSISERKLKHDHHAVPTESTRQDGDFSALERTFGMSVVDGGSADGGHLIRRIRSHSGAQIQTVAPLAIDSLGKPSNVVILQDVDGSHHGLDLSKLEDEEEQEAHVLNASLDHEPTEDEIYESIDALEPASVSLNKVDYDRLIKQLVNGYSKTQLLGYIDQRVPANAANSIIHAPDGSKAATMSIWRKGTTNIQKRLPLEAKLRARNATYANLTEQIVSTVWGAFQQSELQELGELEFVLSKVQATFIKHKFADKNDWEPLLTSTLARAVDIVFHEPSNVLRITARRQDAIAAAYRIADRLKTIVHEQVGLNISSQSAKLLDQNALDKIQLDTETHIETIDKGFSLFSISPSQCFNAKRLICQTLHVDRDDHDPIVMKNTYDPAQHWKRSFGLVPVFGQHSNSYAKPLVRPTILEFDARKNSSAISDDPDHVSRMTSNIETIVKSTSKGGGQQADGLFDPESWSANIGYALRPHRLPPADQRYVTTFSSQLPALARVLSFFAPSRPADITDGVKQSGKGAFALSSKVLVAWLSPSPFTQKTSAKQQSKTLPDLKVSLKITAQTTARGSLWKLGWPSIRLVSGSQNYVFHLTDREADLQLRRRPYTYLQYSRLKDSPSQDKSLLAFIDSIESAKVSSIAEALARLMPDHEIKVPLSALSKRQHSTATNAQAGDAEYICTHLEVQETQWLRPKDVFHAPMAAAARRLLGSWTPDMRLQLTMISNSRDNTTRREFNIVELVSREPTHQFLNGKSERRDHKDDKNRSEGQAAGASEQEMQDVDEPSVGISDQSRSSVSSQPQAIKNLITASVGLIDLSTALSRESA